MSRQPAWPSKGRTDGKNQREERGGQAHAPDLTAFIEQKGREISAAPGELKLTLGPTAASPGKR